MGREIHRDEMRVEDTPDGWIVRADSGEVLGTHATREQAEAHVADLGRVARMKADGLREVADVRRDDAAGVGRVARWG